MKVIELLNDAIKRNDTLFAFELLPPLKGDGREGVFRAIENVLDYNPAYVNITWHREGVKKTETPEGVPQYHAVRKRPGTVGIAAAVQRHFGLPVVPHLICGGMSKYDIEDALIDMDFMDIDNLLALRGDKRVNEPKFTAEPDGHEHAIDLVRQIKAMNRGEFIDGEVEECHHSTFCIGVAGYPEVHESAFSPADDIRRLKQKVDAGADYVVTQMFFDNSKYFKFVDACREAGINVPIVPGLKPLVRESQIKGLAETFSIEMPEELRKAVEACKGNRTKVRQTGIEWCVAQSKELKERGVPALHYYTMSRTEDIAKVAKEIF